MAHELQDLLIKEISLVDFPANSEIVNGKKVARSRVSFYKRDDSGQPVLSYKKLRKYLRERGFSNVEKVRRPKLADDPGTQDAQVPGSEFVHTPLVQQTKSKKGKKKMSKLEKILKSDTASRDEIARAINKRALKIAKRNGHAQVTSADYEQALLKDGAYQAYENAPKATQIAKSEPATMRVTKAEAKADTMARKLMKRAGLSYAKALSKTLQDHPELYEAYTKQAQAGEFFEVPGMSASDLSDKWNTRSADKTKSVADHGNLDDDEDDDDADGTADFDRQNPKRR